MAKLTVEQKFRSEIASVKWAEGYRCRQCSSTEFYLIKGNFNRRCKNKNCNYEESPLLKTAFEGSRLLVTKKMEILKRLQDYWETYNERISVAKLAMKCSINENSVLLFYNAIHKHFTRTGQEYDTADSNFLNELKIDSGVHELYESLYGVIIQNDFGEREPRSEENMIEILSRQDYQDEKYNIIIRQ